MVRRFEAQQREALERNDSEAAERYRLWGLGFLLETKDIDAGEAKRIVSDAEAARLIQPSPIVPARRVMAGPIAAR